MSFFRSLRLLSSRQLTQAQASTSFIPSILARPGQSQASAFSSSSVHSLVRKPTKTKLKTHKGAAKRWISVANDGFKRAKAGRVHLNGSMSPTRLNRLGQSAFAHPAQKRLLRKLLPYNS
ncbi:hypothetical protein T439DRAFT_377724 [Meredithblackwellia eburnea MCA 4105]